MAIVVRSFAAPLLLMTLFATPAGAQVLLQQRYGTGECGCNTSTPAPALLASSPNGRLLSLAGTAIPVGLGLLLISTTDDQSGSEGRTIANSVVLWSGPLLGPSVGYWKGDRRRGLTGVLLRSAVFSAAWLLAPTADLNDGFLPNPNWDGIAVWGAAAAIIVISDVVDISRAR
jgi:hypothetical protein